MPSIVTVAIGCSLPAGLDSRQERGSYARLRPDWGTKRGNRPQRIRRDALASAFANALREADQERLAGLIAPSIEVIVRTAEEDLRTEGPAALDALLAVGSEVWGEGFISGSWAIAAGKPFTTVLFSGIRHDRKRVDLSIGVMAHAGHVVRAWILSVGDLHGRPLREWRSERERDCAP